MSDETRTGAPIEPETPAAEGHEPEEQGTVQDLTGEEDQEASNAEHPMLPAVFPEDHERRALLEAIIYVAEEPLQLEQIAAGLGWPPDTVRADLAKLIESYASAERGVEIRGVAGGFKMFTKPEHHEAVRGFVKTLKPKLKLSLPALETLAVVAYKQPITIPEIQAIRGVNVAGVISTLLNRKLITTAGRKKVIGKPMLYKTTKEFLLQFGLADVSELPNLKELEELSRAAFGEGELSGAPEESDQDLLPDSNASPPPEAQQQEEAPEVEEMVTAVDRAVHGGSGAGPEMSDGGIETEESAGGVRGDS